MRVLLILISLIGLGLTIFPSFLVLAGGITWGTHAGLMFLGMLLWFSSAPFWFKNSSD